MKNLVVVLSLFIGISAMAQSSVGIETGVSFSKLRGDAAIESLSGLTSFVPGIFYEYRFSETLAIKAAFSVQEKGSVATIGLGGVIYNQGDTNFNNQNVTVSEEFIVINPLLKYRTRGTLKFFGNIGPYLGLNSRGGLNNASDFGITKGVGVEFDLEKWTLSIEGRNSLGFADINRQYSVKL